MKRMRLRRLLPPLLACLLLSPSAGGAEAETPAYRLSGIERVVAIADIHGAYDAFLSLLQGTGLVDADLRWSGGETHLVIVGDILDRGAESRAALDLVMRLQEEAPGAGGGVHMVLGNHEVMNLVGELGYVSRDEFSSYTDLESAAVRRRAESRFSGNNPGLSRLTLRSAFSRQYPRGFFGHREAFAPDGVYGAWLLRQPVLLIVNDTAFVHAGLSARLAGTDARAINEDAGAALSGYLEAMGVLIDEGLLFPETGFHRQAPIAGDWLARRGGEAESETGRAAAALRDLAEHPLFAPDGPLWYRGMVDCGPAIEGDRLRAALAALGVRRLVIGHTPTSTHQVQARFEGSLLLADTGMLASYYGGQPAALVFEAGDTRVFYADSGVYEAPSPLPRAVGPRLFGLADGELESVLAEAAIRAQSPLGDGRRLLSLEHGGAGFEAIFSPAPAPGFVPEAAAYRLDRLLGIDMVPVAVRREVQGEEGAVYLDVDALPTAAQRADEGAEAPWCPLEDQLALMRSFDALLGLPQRAPERIRHDAGSGKLVLSGNRSILERDDLNVGDPASLLLTPLLREKLLALDEAALASALGEVLDPERRRILLQRRDALLALEGE